MATIYDVGLGADGDIPIRTYHITGEELVAQRIRARLLSFKGEYFLDTRRGLPYADWKQNKPVDADMIGARVRSEILLTPGVEDVQNYTSRFSDGTLRISGEVIIGDLRALLDAELFGTDPEVTIGI